MIERPHFDSYSIPARICLAIAVGSALVAMVIAVIYFLH
ncbi:hypothetical protein ACVIGB_000506 [Bradyrhizobium sp. USDA 4341]